MARPIFMGDMVNTLTVRILAGEIRMVPILTLVGHIMPYHQPIRYPHLSFILVAFMETSHHVPSWATARAGHSSGGAPSICSMIWFCMLRISLMRTWMFRGAKHLGEPAEWVWFFMVQWTVGANITPKCAGRWGLISWSTNGPQMGVIVLCVYIYILIYLFITLH